MSSGKKLISLVLIFLFFSVIAAHQASADTALRGGSGIANVLTADVLDPSNISLGLYWDKAQYVLGVDPKDTFFGLSVTAGLLSNLEIFGSIPLQIHDDGDKETGLGDGLIGLKYRLVGGGARPAAALFGAFTLPTGDEDKGLGTGGTDFLLGLVGSKGVGPSTLSAQAAYRFVDGMDDVLQYGFGLIFPNDKTLRFFLEYLGTVDLHAHGDDAGQVAGGLRYDIGNRWQVTAGGGVGVYGDGLEAPDWRVFAGLNYYTGGIPGKIPAAPEPPPEPAPPAPPPPKLEPPPPAPPAPPAPPPPAPPPPPPPAPPAPPAPPPPAPPPPAPPPPAPPAPPPPPPAPPKMPPPKLENIYFEFDHFLMRPGDEIKLKEVAEYLKANPEARLVVEGHADSIGTATYNLGLGLRRARTVGYYLIFDLGVPLSRVEFKSYGEMKPAEPNKTDEGRSQNRRGHLMVVE